MFLKNGVLSFDGNRDGLIASADPDIRQFISELQYGTDAKGAEIQS
jgi:hypothetical protein